MEPIFTPVLDVRKPLCVEPGEKKRYANIKPGGQNKDSNGEKTRAHGILPDRLNLGGLDLREI
jgi:hypothetical protein